MQGKALVLNSRRRRACIPPFYDSLLGKLIVWDETRAAALSRLKRALLELEIVVVHTTRVLHQALASDADVATARFDTRWLERWLEGNASRLVEGGGVEAKEVAAT